MTIFPVINPATGQKEKDVPGPNLDFVEEKMALSQGGFRAWKSLSLDDRAERFVRMASLLRHGKKTYAELMAHEMGKPVTQGEFEVEKCALGCEFFAKEAPRLLASETLPLTEGRGQISYQPLGVLLGIMPWNFPFWQVFRFAAPAMMAGNGVLLKHAPNVPGVSLAIEKLFWAADFPEGSFQSLLVDVPVTEGLIRDPRVAAVSLTGSPLAGRRVAALAGESLKKCILELGGSDPFVVLEDAPLEEAVDSAVKSRIQNAGQTCIAAKRFIIHRKHLAYFEEALPRRFRSLALGDPLDPHTEVGPLARLDLLDTIHRQVEGSVKKGAKILCGGEPLSRPGFFYSPTVLAGAAKGQPCWDEETFGPVAALAKADTDGEALAMANDSPYGLGASVWTKDQALGQDYASRLEAGCVFINGMVKSDPALPFGGIKRSGFGRELGAQGIREFTNIKTVWTK